MKILQKAMDSSNLLRGRDAMRNL